MGRKHTRKALLVANASNHTCISTLLALPLLFLDKVSLHIAECVVLIGGKKGPLAAFSERCANARASRRLQNMAQPFEHAWLEQKHKRWLYTNTDGGFSLFLRKHMAAL